MQIETLHADGTKILSDDLSSTVRSYAEYVLGAMDPQVIMTLTMRGHDWNTTRLFSEFRQLLFLAQMRAGDAAGLLRTYKVGYGTNWINASPGKHWSGRVIDRMKRKAGRMKYFVVAEPFSEGGYHLHALTASPSNMSVTDPTLFAWLWQAPRHAGGLGHGDCEIELVHTPAGAAVYLAKRVEKLTTELDIQL